MLGTQHADLTSKVKVVYKVNLNRQLKLVDIRLQGTDSSRSTTSSPPSIRKRRTCWAPTFHFSVTDAGTPASVC